MGLQELVPLRQGHLVKTTRSAQLERLDVGGYGPSIHRHHPVRIGVHHPVSMSDHMIEMPCRSFAQTLDMEGGWRGKPPLYYHPIPLPRCSMTDSAINIVSLSPPPYEILSHFHREGLHKFAVHQSFKEPFILSQVSAWNGMFHRKSSFGTILKKRTTPEGLSLGLVIHVSRAAPLSKKDQGKAQRRQEV
jgi:hypothetical protein